MNSNYTQPLNLGNPEEHSILEFAQIIQKQIGMWYRGASLQGTSWGCVLWSLSTRDKLGTGPLSLIRWSLSTRDKYPVLFSEVTNVLSLWEVGSFNLSGSTNRRFHCEVPGHKTACKSFVVVGGTEEIKMVPHNQDDPRRRRPDITRARKYLHWEPVVRVNTCRACS